MHKLAQKKWLLIPGDPAAAALIEKEVGCSAIVARLLVNRGITTPQAAEAFLNPSWSQLPDPMLLPDVEVAAIRIKQALKHHEKIAIHGDYDSDGVTSAALWMRMLQKLGADVQVHVPHRGRDGYDIRQKFVEQASVDGVKLIITTDCGTQRLDEVEMARHAGIDVIITDHHVPGDKLPDAVAVINPHRKDSLYPFKDMAGVGVAFRAGEALVRYLGKSVDSYRRAYADLVAIGTITDIMPIIGDNRIFVKYGLDELGSTRKPGLRALLQATHLQGKQISAYHIGFIVGPRINAIGRLDDSKIALDLLMTRDINEASNLASQLETANTDRKAEEQRIFAEALEQAALCDFSETFCLALSGYNWHPGVIGLVANKIVERYNRPTIMIAMDQETGIGRGSARSIRPFNIFNAITECERFLLEFGGHSHAAGLSLDNTKVADFAREMNRIAGSLLTEEDLVPVLNVDSEIDPAEVCKSLLAEWGLMQPWGRGNDEPLLVSRGLTILKADKFGKEMNHMRLTLRTDDMEPTESIFWRAGEMVDHLPLGAKIDICYRPEINTYNNHSNVRFIIQDLHPADMDD